MLRIKKSFTSFLPKLHAASTRSMTLSPVALDDDDELARAVVDDPDVHDNNWELNERPDEQELESFWNSVEEDVKNDPKWFTFDNN